MIAFGAMLVGLVIFISGVTAWLLSLDTNDPITLERYHDEHP